MKKQIVSETKQYQPSFPDELLLDDTPKVNSFNGVTSDGVARAIAGASGGVPEVTSGDNGKVLTASYSGGVGSYSWEIHQLGSVTSIQQVSELPASPDANTLYLIPEA